MYFRGEVGKEGKKLIVKKKSGNKYSLEGEARRVVGRKAAVFLS